MQNTFKSLKMKWRALNWQLPHHKGVCNIEHKLKTWCLSALNNPKCKNKNMINLEANCYVRNMSLHLHPSQKNISRGSCKL